MTTSPFRAPGADASGADFDLLTDSPADQALLDETGVSGDADPLFDQEAPFVDAPASASPGNAGPFVDGPHNQAPDGTSYAEDSYERTPRRTPPRSTVYESLPGMPGRGVIVVTAVFVALTALLDFALTGGLSYFFDLTFVVLCLVAAMAVRGHDLFTSGVLPPLAFGLTIAAVAVLSPSTFATGSASTVFLTGLTSHAGALVFGYGVALVTVAGRALHHRNS